MSSISKTAIVTGAGTGIGKAVALCLLDNGFNVTFTGRRMELLEAAAGSRPDRADHAICVAGDVAVETDVDRLFDATVEKFGRVDVLFNNAGIGADPIDIDELPVDVWRRVIDTNLHGAYLCARRAFGQMKKQSPRGGRIINNGSISAYTPRPNSTPYTTSKHAIAGLTKCLALDGRRYDIACGQIDIGNAATEMTASTAEGTPQADGRIAPEPLMDVSHVADSVLHMANLPLDANVLVMNVMATKMPFVGRG